MNELMTVTAEAFLPMAGSKANKAAIARVVEKLPELTEKTKSFGRQNTQTTISLMTLTMMNGHSPMRMLRQVLAEVDKRKSALSQSQIGHIKSKIEIESSSCLFGPLVQKLRKRHSEEPFNKIKQRPILRFAQCVSSLAPPATAFNRSRWGKSDIYKHEQNLDNQTTEKTKN